MSTPSSTSDTSAPAIVADSPTSPPTNAPTMSERYNSDTADMTLVSSDNVMFKVDAFRLQAVSPIFRDLVKMAGLNDQRDIIHLTDPHIECSKIVEKVLDIIYTWKVDDAFDDLPRLGPFVVDFAKKYEMDVVMALIKQRVLAKLAHCDSGERGNPMAQFLTAIKLEDYELAGTCIRANDEWSWGTREGDKPEPQIPLPPPNYLSERPAPGFQSRKLGSVEGGPVFDLSACSYVVFLSLPPTVVWAMLRARRIAQTEMGFEESRNQFAREFITLMNEAYPKSPNKEA